MNIERERRTSFSVANILTMLTIAAALASVYATNAADNAMQKERVDNLKEQTQEIKADVKETKKDVQTILRKLMEMEAADKAASREARKPDHIR